MPFFISEEKTKTEKKKTSTKDNIKKLRTIRSIDCLENCHSSYRDYFNLAYIGAFSTPFVGGLLAQTDKAYSTFAAGIAEGLLLVGIYKFKRESLVNNVEIDFKAMCKNKCYNSSVQENDEKLMKVFNMTLNFAKSGQEYRKFITDFRSSEEKFHLKDAPKLVKYEHIITRIAFLTQMFEQSHQSKDEEERKMLRDMYLLEARDSDDNDNGLIHSFYMLNQLVTGQTVLGDMFGDFYDSGQSKSVLGLDTSLCNPEQCKKLSRLVSSLIIQLKDVFPDQLDFIDDFIQKSVHDCDKSIRSVCRPIR